MPNTLVANITLEYRGTTYIKPKKKISEMPNSVEVAIKVFLSLLMLIFFSLTRNSIELHCNLVWCSVILVSVNQAGKVALK